MKYRICSGLFFLLLSHMSYSQIIATYSINTNSLCGNDDSLVVIAGSQIPALLGHKVNYLSLLSYSSSQDTLQSIVFQVDQKDRQDRYILNDKNKDVDKAISILTDKDELVFRKKDLKQRVEHSSELIRQHALIELEIITGLNDSASTSKWLYIDVDFNHTKSDFEHINLLTYEHAQDHVSSSIYKIGFSNKHPFLLDSFHWRLPDKSAWGDDITDMMKIRHTGRFFGMDFKRTQNDYYSQLIAIKAGPLRVIRRTENRIKVFWKLKSPALFIDYVMMPDGFVMDTMIDIPFNISFFFSDLATFTTMDWLDVEDTSELTVQAAKSYPAMPVNGLSSEHKKAFNQITGNSFSLTSHKGDFNVRLDIPDNFPIQSNLYLKDAQHELDPPENQPGQFGNIGFKTTGWENISSQLYHLNFTVCVAAAK